jgi:hypothetical protein
MIRVVHHGSESRIRILIFTHPGSGGQKGTGSGSATLIGSPPDQKLQSRGLLSPAGLNMAKLQEGVKMFYVSRLLYKFLMSFLYLYFRLSRILTVIFISLF